MKPDSPHDFGRDDVHRALMELPPPRAPRTLLPRVMAAARQAEEARARTETATWFMWPRSWQAASIVALVLLVVGAAWIWPSASAVVAAPAGGALAAAWAWTVEVAWGAAAVVSLTSIMWESFLEPLVPYLFVWIVLMSAACATFGAALGRVALGGATH